jgi:hypothetical protein
MKRTVLEGSRQGWLSSWVRERQDSIVSPGVTVGRAQIMTLTSWLEWVRLTEGLAGHFLRERQITIQSQIHRLPFCSLPTVSRPVSHLSFILGHCPVTAALVQECCHGLLTYIRSLHIRTAQQPEPPGSNYFRQAPSALNSLLYYKRVILRDPPAAAHAPSHYQHSHEPDRLVPGRCITVSLFSRHEPDPVLLRRCPSARPAPTRPVNQPPQWHLYRNKTSYDPYQRPFILQLDPRHGLHPCIRRFQGLDGCQ